MTNKGALLPRSWLLALRTPRALRALRGEAAAPRPGLTCIGGRGVAPHRCRSASTPLPMRLEGESGWMGVSE